MMNTRVAVNRLLLASLALLPSLGLAHAGHGATSDHGALAAFSAGFAHPFAGLDHLAAMLALGVWSALTARRVWTAPLAFAATLCVGAMLGASGVALLGVEPMVASSLLVLGLLLAAHQRLPSAIGAAVAALFALFHGAAHGQELAGHNTLWAIGGMVLASACLHTMGIGLGLKLRHGNTWAPRAVGAVVALFGVALLGGLAA